MNNEHLGLVEKLLAKEEKRKERARAYYLKKRYGVEIEQKQKVDTLKHVGDIGLIELKTLLIKVRVLNFKSEYGRERYLVEPIDGVGQVWVQKIIFN